MKKLIFLCFVLCLVGCSKKYSIPNELSQFKHSKDQVIVDGKIYKMVEPWRNDRLVLWEAVPPETNQYFIANTLGTRMGEKPIFVSRKRDYGL